MRQTFFFLTLLLASYFVYPQTKDTVGFRNAVAFNLEALIVKDIKISFSHRLGKRNFAELMVSYNFPISEDNEMANNSIWALKDPFFYYGRTQVRIGCKHYFGKKFYLGALALYGMGHFDRKDAWYHGDNIHYDLTRDKKELGIIFKTGFTFLDRFLLHDIYLGIGYRYNFFKDTIYMKYYKDSSYPGQHPVYPYNVDRKYGLFSFHLGYQIGYAK